MNARVYVLSFSFGLGLGTTTMHTSDPLGVVMRAAAEGHNVEHVTIRSTEGTAAAQQQPEEQGWKFMEWS